MNNKFLTEAMEFEIRLNSLNINLLECQNLNNELGKKYYFCLIKKGVLLGKIPTKCTRPEQVEEINEFLKNYSILALDEDVVLKEVNE